MNQQQRERVMQFRVGVFVLIALVVFLGIVYLLGARARLFESRYMIHADFTEVGGLVIGATVRLAGVQIGRVSGVHLPTTPGGKVRVDMSITHEYAEQIRQNSIARIETQGLLGDRIVEITVGTAEAPAVKPDGTIVARDPTDIGQVISRGAQTVQNVAKLTESLGTVADTLNRSNIIGEATATVTSAHRTADLVSREAATTLTEAQKLTAEMRQVVTQIDKVVASTQVILDRTERGEGVLGVLTSPDSTAAAKKLVATMDRIGDLGNRSNADEGVLPALLFDPKYRAALDDLRQLSKNLREISDRIDAGQGVIGGLVRGQPAEGSIQDTTRDLSATVANLKEITETLNDGEGTLGALIADPTIYERLVNILDNAQRSFLLRGLLRGLSHGSKTPRSSSPGAAPDTSKAPSERHE